MYRIPKNQELGPNLRSLTFNPTPKESVIALPIVMMNPLSPSTAGIENMTVMLVQVWAALNKF